MKPKSKKKPTTTKSFSKFVSEDLALQQTKNDEVGELHTDTDWKDSFRFSERLRQFREGLLALLAADDKLDDDLLGRFGITKWDIPVEAHFARPRATATSRWAGSTASPPTPRRPAPPARRSSKACPRSWPCAPAPAPPRGSQKPRRIPLVSPT